MLRFIVDPTPIQKYCPHCSAPISDSDFFCPNCGKKLKDKPVSLSPLSLIWLLILSVILPPLGIFRTISYIKSSDQTAKLVGFVSLLLTLGAIIFYTIYTINYFNRVTGEINSQLNQYQF